MSAPEPRTGSPVALRILGLALVLGLALRFAWIGADPSPRLSWSNGIFTDPPVMVHAARNAVLFGHWILDYNRDLWIFPLMNGLTRAIYALTGPARVPTLVLSGLAGLAAVAAVAWGVGRSLGRRAAAIAALLGAANFYLVLFSRVPVAENVVAALLAISIALALGRRPIELAAAGFLGVAATLFGKYHAVGALPGLVVFVAVAGKPRGRALAAVLGGGTLAFLGWLFLFFLPHRADILGHVARQSTGMHGALPFVTSLGEGFGEFVNTIRKCWMFYRMPIVGTVGGLFVIFALLHGPSRRARLSDGTAVWALVFASSWIYFGLLPYKAPRYFVMLAPVLVGCAAVAIELVLRAEEFRFRPPRLWDEHAALVLWLYVFLFTGIDATKHYASMSLEWLTVPPQKISPAAYDGIVRFFSHVDTFHQGLAWAGMLGAVVYVLILWHPEILARTGGFPERIGRPGLRRLATVLVAGAVVLGIVQWTAWASDRTHFIRNVKESLPEMVGPDAVMLGALAPLLTQDSRFRCYPYFGPPNERGLLEKYGVTHVFVCGKGDRAVLEDRFPGLVDSTVTVQVWPLRTLFAGTVELLRLPKAYRGIPIHDYEPTLFERGAEAAQNGEFEAALDLFRQHREAGGAEFPELVSLESVCWFTLQDYDRAEERIREALRLRPDDPLNWRNLGSLHLQRGERPEAIDALVRALKIDPKNEEMRSMLQELKR